jgi:hypothetical protein
MNGRCIYNIVHLLVMEPKTHAVNPEHVVQMGLTECSIYFTWRTGPRYKQNEFEERLTPTPSAPTCLQCLWQADR